MTANQASTIRTKAALIRRAGYPIGAPAPCYFRCCDCEIDQPQPDESAECPTCGNQFDARGNITPGLMCFCAPGDFGSIIDVALDGRGSYSGQTLEQIRERHPGAEIRPLAWFCREKAQQQDRPITWHESTEDIFESCLGCLPPALRARGGFLVGEPSDHHALLGAPRYQAYVRVGDRFFASSRPMTAAEFRTVAMPPK